jgi:integrase/recombinase XerC/integrase/recombinase XerD
MDLVLEKTNPDSSVAIFEEGIPDIELLVGEWLGLDVANGDACADTLKTYRSHFSGWLAWCDQYSVVPGQATTDDVKLWRQHLVAIGSKSSTIALKLTTVRRFYQAAVDRGMITTNPVATVRPPRERRAVKDKIKYLTAGEAELLFRAVPNEQRLKPLRDRAMIALMALEGLRRVEIMRANVEDIEVMVDGGIRLLVHGKGKEGYVYPREDTAQAIETFLLFRGKTDPDTLGVPLFTRLLKGGVVAKRITRSGINRIIDTYLLIAGVKRAGVSCHALRHTCGTLLYQATRDVRAVQETLRQSNINTAAIYAGIVDRGKARYTKEIQVKINIGANLV